MTQRATVVHLVDASVSDDARAVLSALLGEPTIGQRSRVLHLGTGPLCAVHGAAVARVYAPCPADWAVGRVLARRLRVASASLGGDTLRSTILHAWSLRTARACATLATTQRPLLITVEPGADVCQLARLNRAACVGFVSASQHARQVLLDAGVPAPRCVTIPPLVENVPPPDTRRAAVRARLRLAPLDVALLALPPVERTTGTYAAAWAAFVLEKVHPNVRLVIPAGGADHGRVRRLAEACRHEWMVRLAPPDLRLDELLGSADLAVYLPDGDAAAGSLAQAVARGVPLVAADVPMIREFCPPGYPVWCCRPRDPEDAARTMLKALEGLTAVAARAGKSARTWNEAATRSGVVESYRRVYENLASRRPASAGLCGSPRAGGV